MADVMLCHLEKLEADSRALADVRTLDEWARADDARFWTTGPQYFAQRFYCTLWANSNTRACETFTGATPDEARAKAAAWVRGLK